MKNHLFNILSSIIAFYIPFQIALLTDLPLVKNLILLIFFIQWISFIPAFIFQTEKFYDLTGSLTYLSVVWYSLALASQNFADLNKGNIVIVVLISMWAVRLGSFLFMRIHKDGEDKRFRTIKPSATQFFMTWTLQGLWVSLCSMCALTAIASETGVLINNLFYFGFSLFVLGFAIEIVADNQKSKFRSVPDNRNKYITSGLWAKSRHPNFFGEIMLWTGIAVMSFSSLNGMQYLTLISPFFTYLLLVYVSGVRMLEARADKKWGDDELYIKYKDETPVLFIKFWK